MRTQTKFLAGIFLMVVGVTAFAAWGQQLKQSPASQTAAVQGFPHDWSHRHLIFARPSSPEQARLLEKEPRYQIQQAWRSHPALSSEAYMQALDAQAVKLASSPILGASLSRLQRQPTPKPTSSLHRDWSNVMGGTGGVGSAANTFPAKYSFSLTSASCATDFVVYPTGTSGATPSGTLATQSGTFAADPTAGQTVTLNGTNNSVVLTASSSSNTGLNFQVGSGVGTDATNLAEAITRWGGAVGVTATSPSSGVVKVSSINDGITTTLSAAITTTSTTTIPVTAGTGFVNGDYIQIDNEKLLITAGGGTTSLTATRAQLGTSAATHSINATVTDISNGGNSIASSTLTSSITISATTIPVAAGTGFEVGDYIVIDSEKLLITAGAGTTSLTATRAQLGTTAATHSSGAVVSDISMSGGVTLLETLSNFSWTGRNLTGGTGKPGQPTVFALTNLYSGCGTTATIAVPATFWSYNTTVTGTGSTTVTSPVLSLLGDQVAFVQTNSSGVAELVILRWSSTSSVGTLGAPTSLTNQSSGSNYHTCTGPCMYVIAFSGGTNDTGSSPFYDYTNDIIYVGDNSGNLHKFTGVFNGAPAEVVSSGTNVWPAVVSSGNKLTSPVYDTSSGLVFVGSARGTSSGGSIHSVSITIGSGTGGVLSSPMLAVVSSTGIADAPIVDSSASKAYVFVGDDANKSGNSAVYQYTTGSSVATQTPAKQTVGSSGGTTTILYTGSFDNTYYTGNGTTGNLYVCAAHNSGTTPNLYRVAMNSGFTGTVTQGPEPTSANAATCSPVTEIFNTDDYIFIGVSAFGDDTGCAGACVYSYNLATVTWSTSGSATDGLPAVGGASGIIIDNAAASPTGASEIYFMSLSSPGNAVQATQTGLQ